MFKGGAKPKKNEQITLKNQLIYEGPFDDYTISVNVGDKKVKVVFKAAAEKKKESQPIVEDNPFGDGQDVNQTDDVTLDAGFPTYNFENPQKEVEAHWYMSDRFDHQLFEIFVKFFFGFEIQKVKTKYKEYVLDEQQPLEPIYRKNSYEQFEYYQNIFKLYSFNPSKSDTQILTPVWQIDVYEIDNKIFNYKDLFNNIELTDNIICVQYETNVKCPIYWSLKTLTIYPNFGQNAFSIVYKLGGVIQVQIIQGSYLYVFSLKSDLYNDKTPKQQNIIQIVPLQIKIKKFVKMYFEVQQQFQYEHSQFMMNFSDHFEIQKLSNTNYKIDFLNDVTVLIYTRYSTLFFSTISDNIDTVKMYFRICQNCGNFVQTQPISDLNSLQIVSPLEFGNTQISNFEHQLESMKKRPSIIPDPTLKEVLADEDVFMAQQSPSLEESTVANEMKRQFVNIQNTMSLEGYLIDGFKFYCNKDYPYLNFTKLDVEFQEDGQSYPLYYYKCQQMPIKATVQNVYKLYDVYRHFRLNETFKNSLYNQIHGLIQQKPNLFLKYEIIVPGQYTILPQNLYKIFPNTTFLLKLVMKDDEKITLSDYYNAHDDAPWDNEWLASVCGGQSIQLHNSVFYNIELNQYFCYKYQPQYDYVILVYQQQFFTLITYQEIGEQIQLGRGRQKQQRQGYELYKIDFVFDKSINKYVEGYEFNDEYIQTKYLKRDVIISKQNNIYGIISQNQKISEPYTQKSTYDQTYIINQDKDVIGYKQYNNYVYYVKPEKIDYNQTYVLGNTIVKEDPSITVDSNIDLTIGEIASIIVFNNKRILLEELPKISENDINKSTVNKLYSKLQLNIGKTQQLKLYYTKINPLSSIITEQQAKDGIEHILKMKPDSENLLESFIVHHIFDEQLYYNPRRETIKQLSSYVQMQNVLRYRTVIQQ